MHKKSLFKKITHFFDLDQTSAMIKKFLYALTWNSINIFAYKTILLIHQIVLFYFIPQELYGVSGTLFAALYLLIGCTGLGFEYSLFTFFASYSQNRSTLKGLYYQSLFKILITVSMAVGIYAYISTHPTLVSNVPTNLLPYLMIIFIAESLRKYFETIAQLAFLNKQITYIQVSMIITYVILVWAAYVVIGAITLQAIFIPMVIVSLGETCWTLRELCAWTETIPTDTSSSESDDDDISKKNGAFFIKEYLYNYINQLSKNLFSPNFLMLLIAWTIGMKETGIVRYFTNIITLLYMLFGRAIGVPSGAIFSTIKKRDSFETKKTFLSITNTYIQLLYVVAIVITTTVVPIIIRQTNSAITNIILLFIISGFIEYITITYEKLYLVQGAARQLARINGMSAAICFLYVTSIPMHNSLFLLPICCIRTTTMYAIAMQASNQWHVSPRITPLKRSLFVGVFLSLCAYLIIWIATNLLCH